MTEMPATSIPPLDPTACDPSRLLPPAPVTAGTAAYNRKTIAGSPRPTTPSGSLSALPGPSWIPPPIDPSHRPDLRRRFASLGCARLRIWLRAHHIVCVRSQIRTKGSFRSMKRSGGGVRFRGFRRPSLRPWSVGPGSREHRPPAPADLPAAQRRITGSQGRFAPDPGGVDGRWGGASIAGRSAAKRGRQSSYPATIAATTAATAAITAAGVAIQVNMRFLSARNIVRPSVNSSCSFARPYRSRFRCFASSFRMRSIRSSDAAIASRCSPSGTGPGQFVRPAADSGCQADCPVAWRTASPPTFLE